MSVFNFPPIFVILFDKLLTLGQNLFLICASKLYDFRRYILTYFHTFFFFSGQHLAKIAINVIQHILKIQEPNLSTRTLNVIFKLYLNKHPRGVKNSQKRYTVFPHIVSAKTILFWLLPYVLWPLITVLKCAETIQGRKLYEEIRYLCC